MIILSGFHCISYKNGLKERDDFSPFLFSCALEYAIKRVQVNQDGLKLNGTHQFLVYADDNTYIGRKRTYHKKNTDALVADKTKYLVMSRDQNAVQYEVTV